MFQFHFFEPISYLKRHIIDINDLKQQRIEIPFFTLNKFVSSIHTEQIEVLISLGQYSTITSKAKNTVLAMQKFPR